MQNGCYVYKVALIQAVITVANFYYQLGVRDLVCMHTLICIAYAKLARILRKVDSMRTLLSCRYNDFSDADLTNKRTKYMRSCANLPADPPMRLEGPPSLLLVNRQQKGICFCHSLLHLK